MPTSRPRPRLDGCIRRFPSGQGRRLRILGGGNETVKITPQMTRFRDVKVCNNLATDEIDDHRIQSDYKMICNIQNERTLHLVLRMRGEDSRHQ